MKKLMILAVLAAVAAAGCRVVKVNRTADGEYSIYDNSHWLNTEADAISGSMSPDGRLEFSVSGTKSSPSEEFNKSMQTFTAMFAQIAQIAAAAYNPSASAASAKPAAETPVTVNVTTASTNATASVSQPGGAIVESGTDSSK